MFFKSESVWHGFILVLASFIVENASSQQYVIPKRSLGKFLLAFGNVYKVVITRC